MPNWMAWRAGFFASAEADQDLCRPLPVSESVTMNRRRVATGSLTGSAPRVLHRFGFGWSRHEGELDNRALVVRASGE